MDTRVFKFGGASIVNHNLIINFSRILKSYSDCKIVVVISAMGKTTNTLEIVTQKYIEAKKQVLLHSLLNDVIDSHLKQAQLLGIETTNLLQAFEAFITESQKRLNDIAITDFEMIYDQIVPLGELFSTTLVAQYLSYLGMNSTWLDVRSMIYSDDKYTDASVNYDLTVRNIIENTASAFEHAQFIITQGFIASSPTKYTTTLGREGSDYTAALMAYALEVEELSIWKDVPGILTADPKKIKDATLIPKISYREAIEMTYFGAKVIHPKTIIPIQNKGIRLHVRSYITPNKNGTLISQTGITSYPPIIVVQDEKLLIKITTKDFTFIAENHLSLIFKALDELNIKMNLMRNSAISFTLVVSSPGQLKLQKFINELGDNFSVEITENLQLMTIRHANPATIEVLTKDKVILLVERMNPTIQFVIQQ